MATIIDGKAIAAKIRGELAEEVKRLASAGIQPGLAVVLVGEDPASRVYVTMKEKACTEVGIFSDEYKLHAETSESDLLALIDRLNNDPRIHGILVQLPLPAAINTDKVLEAISPFKDVDGFHPYNVGRLVIGKPIFRPCTPYGVMVLLKEAGIDLTGKEVVVVGRSNIVGKPVAFMCLQQHATVTLCHTQEGAVVIDVGVNRVGEKKLVGDVEFAKASERASAITPVPGGVGPMTITMLLCNTVEAAKKQGLGTRD
jgi:methylenetetrahydrofolate dehydrogenase (NADP+)/methenyltetrahydrofolate cyclohydrolase